MRITVDLTDEQADFYGEGNYHCDAERVLGDAVVTARPKPLKVGDKVKGDSGQDRTVLGFGIDSKGRRWLMIDGPYGHMSAYVPTHTMADGSPIVWPA